MEIVRENLGDRPLGAASSESVVHTCGTSRLEIQGFRNFKASGASGDSGGSHMRSVTWVLLILLIVFVGFEGYRTTYLDQESWLFNWVSHSQVGGPPNSAQVRHAEQQSQELDARNAFLRDRIAAKSRLLQEFLQGQRTLLQTAAAFHNLNEMDPHFEGHFRRAFPGNSDGEKMCRQVIYWANQEIEDFPTSQMVEMQERWEKELADHLARHNGIVVLPVE